MTDCKVSVAKPSRGGAVFIPHGTERLLNPGHPHMLAFSTTYEFNSAERLACLSVFGMAILRMFDQHFRFKALNIRIGPLNVGVDFIKGSSRPNTIEEVRKKIAEVASRFMASESAAPPAHNPASSHPLPIS